MWVVVNPYSRCPGLGMVKFTQPVLVCKLEEEYTPPIGMASKTPAVTGQVLVKGDGDGALQIKGKNVPVGNCNLHVYDAMVSSRYF